MGEQVANIQSLTGSVLDGRYEVGEILGFGGMGAVYRGVQRSVGRKVAIKVLKAGVITGESQQRFEREARVMAGLEHPNIVRLYDFGQHDGSVFMVLELVDGNTLHDLLQGYCLGESLALELIRQIATGMAEAHARGIVHRDLKPANLMMVGDSSGAMRVVILDFGLARPSRQDVRMTTDGLVYGTPEYIAPEYARGAEFDELGEMYSLGVVLFELLTGSPPFKGDPLQVLFQQVCEPVPTLDRAVQEGTISAECRDLVEGLLAKDPANRRPGSMMDLVHRIEAMGVGRRRSVKDVMDALRPKLVLDRAPNILTPSPVRAGSTPFLQADEAVKGAWESYVKTGEVPLATRPMDAVPTDQAASSSASREIQNSGFGGNVIDPNIDSSHEFVGDLSESDRMNMKTILSSDVSRSQPISAVDQSAEIQRITTEKLSAVGMRPIEAFQTLPASSVEIQAPKVREEPPKPQRPAAPELAFDPRQRFAEERAVQPKEKKRNSAQVPFAVWLVVVAALVFFLVAVILQSRNFGAEEDTMTKEEFETYKKETIERQEAERREASSPRAR